MESRAALLAEEGFVGPRRIFEGRDGFLHGYSRNPEPQRLTADLGKSYEILHTAVNRMRAAATCKVPLMLFLIWYESTE